jgi:hypothetical protein
MAANNQPRKIPDDTIEEIYLKWADGKPLTHLVKEYGISLNTLSKYKKLGKWGERRAKIQNVVAKRTDKTLATRKARRAKLGAKLQAEGLKTVKDGIKNEQVALNAIKLGAEMEDQAYGDTPDDGAVIQIKLPKGTQIGYIGNDK